MESNTQTKWSSLQMQVAMLSLTMASIQTQLKQLETEFAQFKADSKPTFQELNDATSALSVDDSASEGYDTDESDEEKPKPPKAKTRGVDRYVMISNYCEKRSKRDDGEDSGYDSEDSLPKDTPTFVPEDTSLNPFNNDLVTEDWKTRALLLEEL